MSLSWSWIRDPSSALVLAEAVNLYLKTEGLESEFLSPVSGATRLLHLCSQILPSHLVLSQGHIELLTTTTSDDRGTSTVKPPEQVEALADEEDLTEKSEETSARSDVE